VPAKYKGLLPELGLRGKTRSQQGLLESQKKTEGSLETKMHDVSIMLLEKE